MISREQARVYLNSQPVINITEKDLTSFSGPYQVLGRIISRLTHERYGNTAVIRLYTAHVSNDPAFNPGKRRKENGLRFTLRKYQGTFYRKFMGTGPDTTLPERILSQTFPEYSFGGLQPGTTTTPAKFIRLRI